MLGLDLDLDLDLGLGSHVRLVAGDTAIVMCDSMEQAFAYG